MNYLVNLVVLWLGLFYITPFISDYLLVNPLIKKLGIFFLIISIQYIYESIRNITRKKDLKISKILDRGIHRASLVVLGLVLLSDLKKLNLISDQFSGVSMILNTRWGETTFLLLPIFISICLKCLLKPI